MQLIAAAAAESAPAGRATVARDIADGAREMRPCASRLVDGVSADAVS
jgi:hypothetical protein